MDEIDIMILPKYTDRSEGEEYYQGYDSHWRSIQKYKDLEIIITAKSVTDSDAARKVFLEILEEIHKDIRKNIRLVRKLLALGETSGFSGGTCISITKTSSGYKRYFDYWGGLVKSDLGNTFRDAILARIQTHKRAKKEVKKEKRNK